MDGIGFSRWRHVPSRLLVIAVALVGGCGRPPQAAVRGTVTVDGTPLAAGRVVFAGEGRSYVGTIEADGRYELRHQGKPQILTGDYGVGVLPPEPRLVADPKTTNLRELDPVDPKRYPARFRNPATSGLSMQVAPGESVFDIDLASQ